MHSTAGRHGDVIGAGHHSLRDEVERLLDEPHCRSTVVAGTASGQPAGQHSIAADVQCLVADLHDAAHHHVVDDRGIEVVPLRKGLQGLRRQIGRMPPGQACRSVFRPACERRRR